MTGMGAGILVLVKVTELLQQRRLKGILKKKQTNKPKTKQNKTCT